MSRLFAIGLSGMSGRHVGNKAMTQRLWLGPPKTRSVMLRVAMAASHQKVISVIGVIDDGSRSSIRRQTERGLQGRIARIGVRYRRHEAYREHNSCCQHCRG